jgi:glycosyltransferase involved in cell wall biosynthesis
MSSVKLAHITTIDASLRYLLLNQLTSLRQAGYDVTGISTAGPDVPVVEAAGIRHIAVSMTRRAFTPLSDLCSLWKLYWILRRERFTIVHTHTPKAGLLGRWAAKLAGVPVIVHTSHGFIFHDGSPWWWRQFFVQLERWAAMCADLVFSVNEEDVRTALREKICPPGKIVALGGEGVDTHVFDRTRFSSADLARKRREVGLPEDVPVVGFVGRLVREKGVLELFEAARLVRACVPDVRFLVIGPIDSVKPDVVRPETASEYGVADICIFTGMREDTPELYPLMDVFVLPSHREGFPRSPMEASAMGVPSVVTDIRGCREVIEHNRNGLRVPVEDVQSLANAITGLLTDRETARRMGAEGRRMALECFDEQLIFARVKSEYARLLCEKRLPVPEPQGEPQGAMP